MRRAKPIYKAVIRYKLITRGRKIIGVDPESRRVEYLPAGEEGRKSFEHFISLLAKEVTHETDQVLFHLSLAGRE